MHGFDVTIAFRRSAVAVSIAIMSALLFAHPAAAGPREQAKRIHDRLVGVPPSAGVLDAMEALLVQGDALGAADLAMQEPAFYSVALKDFVTPWTSVEQTVFAPLNDYTATVIGMIRDDVPFDQVLSADLVYAGAAGVVPAAYSHTNNTHYEQLEDRRIDLSNPALFAGRTQSGLPGAQINSSEAAGVITTRSAGEAFFSAGTNRRMWRFTTMNFLCRDMEALSDISRPADRIRQDVTRSPGGDSSIFQNQCVGCHNGMDPMAGAYAYFEWDENAGRVVHTPGQVQPKYLINADSFPFGYVTIDNRWDNYWRQGPNAQLGWRSPEAGGYGAQGLGREVAASRAFSQCQVQKVFSQVCFRPVASNEDSAEVERIADVFEANNYSMKRVFAETAAYCMGD